MGMDTAGNFPRCVHLVECYQFRLPESSVRAFEVARECSARALYGFTLGHRRFFVSSD